MKKNQIQNEKNQIQNEEKIKFKLKKNQIQN